VPEGGEGWLAITSLDRCGETWRLLLVDMGVTL
jgi:hypothetical protein